MIRVFRVFVLVACISSLSPALSAQSMDKLLPSILQQRQDSLLQALLAQPERYRYQILYTEINRDKNNQPQFVSHAYHVDDDLYFYPASVVKLPAALLALEKINELAIPGFDRNSRIWFDSAQSWQSPLHADSSAPNGEPSIAQFIREAFLVSENEAYNRLYQFIGQEQFNRRLHAKGFTKSRITRQFIRISPEQNRHSNPFRVFNQEGKVIYQEPDRVNKDSFDFSKHFELGKAHMDWQDSLIDQPLDFSTHNYMPLRELNDILKTALFPELVQPAQRFKLREDQYRFVYQYLSQFPGETNYPKYDSGEYYNSYVKFFFKGLHKDLPEGLRVFNKVGWAYGCLTDISYVVDFRNNIEFMLAATVYVNDNEILNDNQYQYEETGLPFLYQVGQAIYDYELSRKRTYKPDLSKFRIDYEQRVDDGRPTIGAVDN